MTENNIPTGTDLPRGKAGWAILAVIMVLAVISTIVAMQVIVWMVDLIT